MDAVPNMSPDPFITYPILRFFRWDHLPEHLQIISKPFMVLALQMANNPGLTYDEVHEGLRKLLEAKDCFVRAAVN